MNIQLLYIIFIGQSDSCSDIPELCALRTWHPLHILSANFFFFIYLFLFSLDAFLWFFPTTCALIVAQLTFWPYCCPRVRTISQDRFDWVIQNHNPSNLQTLLENCFLTTDQYQCTFLYLISNILSISYDIMFYNQLNNCLIAAKGETSKEYWWNILLQFSVQHIFVLFSFLLMASNILNRNVTSILKTSKICIAFVESLTHSHSLSLSRFK